MFKYLVLDIKREVYRIRRSDFRRLKVFEMIWGIIFIFMVIVFVVGSFLKPKIQFFFYLLSVLWMVVFFVYDKYEETRHLDQYRKTYFNRKICRLIMVLKKPEWNLYNEPGIQWIIEQCNWKLEKEGSILHIGRGIGKWIYIILPPFLTFFLRIINENDILDFLRKYDTLLSDMLIFLFSFVTGIALLAVAWRHVKNDFYLDIRNDMEYLLVKIKHDKMKN